MCLAEDGTHASVTHKSLLEFCATPPRAVALRLSNPSLLLRKIAAYAAPSAT